MAEAPRRLRLGDPVADLRAGLLRGEVAAVPTESSYALAVDPRSIAGVERIFALKARERGKPLPVVAASLEQVMSLGVRRDDPGLRWGLRYWPAPLTVLLEVEMPLAAMVGDTRLGVRIPAHAGLRRLLGELGIALTATSANLSGEPPITSVEALGHQLGGALSWIVDDGPLPGGEPSTVVAWSPATVSSGAQAERGRMEVLRRGAFPWH